MPVGTMIRALLESNRRFVAEVFEKDRGDLTGLGHAQNSTVLWIGCSDSRVGVSVRPLCTVPDYVHLEHVNTIAALQEAAQRFSMLRIISEPSGNRVVRLSRRFGGIFRHTEPTQCGHTLMSMQSSGDIAPPANRNYAQNVAAPYRSKSEWVRLPALSTKFPVHNWALRIMAAMNSFP